jgi:probable O-glycosylation ligase (exosortase A-associated)
MKQLLFLSVVTIVCGVAALSVPFWGVLLYYGFALLRPQYLWAWALPVEWRWSLTAMTFVMMGAAFNLHQVVKQARLNPIMTLITIYGLLQIISLISAADPGVALSWFIDYGKVLIAALLASVLITHTDHVRWLGMVSFAALGYIAYEVNYLYVINGRLDIFHVGYGGLDNNGAALLIAMGIPFAYAFACVPLHPRFALLGRGFAAIIGLMMMHAVMMTYSRGAMLAAIVGLVWLVCHHRQRWQALLAAPVIYLLVTIMAGQEIRHRFFSAWDFENDTSAQSRLESWEWAWDLAWKSPWFGHGIRNSALFAHAYGGDFAGRTIHSVFLQIAADSGFIALGVFLILIVFTYWRLRDCRIICRHLLRREEFGPQTDAISQHNLAQLEHIALAGQGSLVIYCMGGAFLSVEILESAWLLTVLAGVFPLVLQYQINRLRDEVIQAEHDQHRPDPDSDSDSDTHAASSRPIPAALRRAA